MEIEKIEDLEIERTHIRFFENLETKSQRDAIVTTLGRRARDRNQPAVGPRCPTILESNYISYGKGLEEVKI